jgi:hypothetical protein
MPKILVIHGAGMNMRGKVQLGVFGPMTLPVGARHENNAIGLWPPPVVERWRPFEARQHG